MSVQFPPWIAKNRATLSEEELRKYEKQQLCFQVAMPSSSCSMLVVAT
jgi:hypothetical protein